MQDRVAGASPGPITPAPSRCRSEAIGIGAFGLPGLHQIDGPIGTPARRRSTSRGISAARHDSTRDRRRARRELVAKRLPSGACGATEAHNRWMSRTRSPRDLGAAGSNAQAAGDMASACRDQEVCAASVPAHEPVLHTSGGNPLSTSRRGIGTEPPRLRLFRSENGKCVLPRIPISGRCTTVQHPLGGSRPLPMASPSPAVRRQPSCPDLPRRVGQCCHRNR